MFHSETEPDEAMRPILALEITARERECLLCETILSELHAQGSSIYYTGKRRHLMTPPPHHPAPQARIDARLAKEPREHTRSKESDTDATSTGVFEAASLETGDRAKSLSRIQFFHFLFLGFAPSSLFQTVVQYTLSACLP